MLRAMFITGLAVTLVLVAAPLARTTHPPTQTAVDRPATAGCGNFLKQEPLVTYDLSGSTFAGPLHKHLAVYNNGLVAFSETFLQSAESRAVGLVLAPSITRQLWNDLRDEGALERCDGHGAGADIPLKTVTMFRGSTDAEAHTFSFYSGEAFGDIELIFDAFIATYIPAP